MDRAQGNRKEALWLYQWNIRASEAVYAQLSVLEVVLRNAMDRELRDWHAQRRGDPGWLLARPMEPPLMGLVKDKADRAFRHAENAKKAAANLDGAPPTHDDVLAQTMFGLWKDLLPNHAQNSAPEAPANVGRQFLWDQALKHAFPEGPEDGGKAVYSIVTRLHELRNRVSHMEPLLRANLSQRMQDAHRLLGFIEPAVREWVSGQNSVPALMRERTARGL
ncbi:hypothetical protein [Arthrobacter sp. UM1]|uniref:hypothetical protein n=1 Tax=Arthrobacter sp. UM1 TaxID=2766776 RepID=UPI001CF644B6|nr:hypothetical protein [Arthrobacter sp. UM1]MCB4209007.1 hypothetical protein [Arthrobacter sp. UM1]